jgi:hypothetical protein
MSREHRFNLVYRSNRPERKLTRGIYLAIDTPPSVSEKLNAP